MGGCYRFSQCCYKSTTARHNAPRAHILKSTYHVVNTLVIYLSLLVFL
ncbi:MAG: hypothetical protein ACTS46_01390 [Candidatus Hodgkinia cicadicola]